MADQTNHRETVTKVLNLYRIAANVTGVFLLIISALYAIRLIHSADLWMFLPDGNILGFASFTLDAQGFKTGLPTTGIDLTSMVLIVHGWLYVFYLYTDFRLWSLLKWNLGRFLLIAAGGVVPLLSFFAERHFRKVALAEIENLKG
jgi:integral membrane protein